MNVTRIHDQTGTHIEPPLGQSWPEARKLEWQAAVTSTDTGLDVQVHEANVHRDGRPIGGLYQVRIAGSTTIAGLGFTETWAYLIGVAAGVLATKPAADVEWTE